MGSDEQNHGIWGPQRDAMQDGQQRDPVRTLAAIWNAASGSYGQNHRFALLLLASNRRSKPVMVMFVLKD